MNKRKICVVTGTRADYGLLFWLLKELHFDDRCELQVIATGMHLSPEFGLTYRQIEDDGFRIDAKVEMLLSSDSPIGIAKSMGLGVIGFADAYQSLVPDLLVVLGDRFEILAAVQAALPRRIPVAHIAGGDTTEGAMDEAIRHSITKMSHLHFVTNDSAARRVRQLGENPQFIFNVGSPGIDQIKRLELLRKPELEAALGFSFRERNLLITFHPATLEEKAPSEQFTQLLMALSTFGDDYGFIFTRPNADTDGRVLNAMIDEFVVLHDNSTVHTSLGQLRYLSVLALVDVVVGNSSSGLYEAPSLHTATVNIGDRQKGRLQASSVINCEPHCEAIRAAIEHAVVLDCSMAVNPYGDGDSSPRIAKVLCEIGLEAELIKKSFFDF
ncbi:MAG: UDP-N-acetylglucosamine 2-epimerase [Desulfuromonadales bacterium]|nr:UDP-N-acetylglucosamine 2-epimerase [Desulfuromonadales bacterium]MDW7756465.1 UDP-N-acetylglucosamine 2-epimerase [Desulfuromonadales bacterium]